MGVRVATINVNGIRAALRNGMTPWIAEAAPDVIAMQEVRAPDALVREALETDWHVAHSEATSKGRAGVAVISKSPFTATGVSVGPKRFVGQGRWAEATIETTAGPLVIVSTYVHTGDETNPDRMEEKHAFFRAAIRRLEQLRATGAHVLWTGDLNVAHQEVDLKNWKGNRGKAGFMEEERAHFDRIIGKLGWVDLGRKHGGDGPGPYSWWSFRGKAFDIDSGWRIDYLIATPELAALSLNTEVHRAPSYAERWSDHAPVVADFDLELLG